jgi:flagellar hook-associated protein 1 FlgK
VARINEIGAEIQTYNLAVRTDARHLEDPGLDAQVHTQLEALSELADFDLIRSGDGSYNVNLGGQTPLTIGGSLFEISADFSGSQVSILNHQGRNITGQVQQGRLRAHLDTQNRDIPALTADLDRLAESIATSVNGVLASGLDRNGAAPQTALFSFDAALGAAATLTVNDLAPEELAAASAASPGGNGNALALADLGRARLLDDYTASQFLGNLTGRLGRQIGNSRTDEQSQGYLLSQSRALREKDSEVSLDEEAANLVAFQRQYEANAQLIAILNSLTQTTIDLLR